AADVLPALRVTFFERFRVPGSTRGDELRETDCCAQQAVSHFGHALRTITERIDVRLHDGRHHSEDGHYDPPFLVEFASESSSGLPGGRVKTRRGEARPSLDTPTDESVGFSMWPLTS